jgi:serine/threonine protein kinase
MNQERSERIRRLQEAAREKQIGERTEFLDSACAGDEALRHEVEAALANEAGGTTQTFVPVGSQLGPYKLEARLGAGGMGEVFRATDTRPHRAVAIKILPRDKVADPNRKRRFLQEARAASSLNHPNIVAIFDIAGDGGVDYLVMEYVPGKSLDKLIASKGLPVADALELAAQTANALAAAHAVMCTAGRMGPKWGDIPLVTAR